jgi:chromosome segregation ATPase
MRTLRRSPTNDQLKRELAVIRSALRDAQTDLLITAARERNMDEVGRANARRADEALARIKELERHCAEHVALTRELRTQCDDANRERDRLAAGHAKSGEYITELQNRLGSARFEVKYLRSLLHTQTNRLARSLVAVTNETSRTSREDDSAIGVEVAAATFAAAAAGAASAL